MTIVRTAARAAPKATLLAIAVALGFGWQARPGSAGTRFTPSIGHFVRVAQPRVDPGKPVPVFFLSALYCPFCAAERWALADALGRFGTWEHLLPSRSTTGVDGFSAIPTYDFVHARYTSQWVAFTARDVADAQGNALEPLRPEEKTVIDRYDPQGSIPFLLIAGAFAEMGSGYSPGLLVNKSFAQVRADLSSGASEGRAIQHEADVLTALICVADGNAPPAACDTPAVRGLEAQAR